MIMCTKSLIYNALNVATHHSFRKHIEYATSAWNSILKINLIESVQMFTLKVCTNLRMPVILICRNYVAMHGTSRNQATEAQP